MYQIYNEDCLQGMSRIPDGSVDAIICDPPYSVTEFRWDKLIDFSVMWQQFRRLIRDRRAIVLFGQEPFASKVRLSAQDIYRYDWVWKKSRVANVMNSSVAPLRIFENIMVFSNGSVSTWGKNQMVYNPQGLKPYNKKSRSSSFFFTSFRTRTRQSRKLRGA